jgi:hypothetical protein
MCTPFRETKGKVREKPWAKNFAKGFVETEFGLSKPLRYLGFYSLMGG